MTPEVRDDRYQLVLIRPEGFVFVESFREVMESLQAAFDELGIACESSINEIEKGTIPILFGAHHLHPDAIDRLPPETIIYNMEQLLPGYPWYSNEYLNLLGRFRVWDSHLRNIVELRARGFEHPLHLPVGYMPTLSRIVSGIEDVDVLFFGVITEHRQRVLEAIASRGINVTVLNGIFGAERDTWLARAKLVVNIRQNPGGLLETPRLAFLLANKKVVVSEPDESDEDHGYGDAIAFAPADRIPDLCRKLLDDPATRKQLSDQGYKTITSPSRRTTLLLNQVLDHHLWPRIALVGDLSLGNFYRQYERNVSTRSSEFQEYSDKPELQASFERIAFYLPQFHRTSVNDNFWGEGFTDWTNVTRALPRFAGHYQPRRPGVLGYYDLACESVLPRQIALARNYGLTGFMFFFYWLESETVLETPLKQFLTDKSLDFRFFLMWANENWTRRWDGMENEILLRQDYSPASMEKMARRMLEYFKDPRYLCVGNRPLLAIYRANQIPDIPAFIALWRGMCSAEGLGNPYFLMAQSSENVDPNVFGLDAALEYPPHFHGQPREVMPQDITRDLSLYDLGKRRTSPCIATT